MLSFSGLFLSSFHALLCHITDVRFGPNYGAAFSLNKIGYGIGVFSGKFISFEESKNVRKPVKQNKGRGKCTVSLNTIFS